MMNKQHVSVRAAIVADAGEIARLSGELGYPTAVQEMTSRLERLLEDPGHHVIVAEGSQGLLGWVHVERRRTLESPDRAELAGLVIDAAARRSGLGARLVSAAERWAATRGLDEITVRSNVKRAMSHPFYEKAGYARVKTQHVYVKGLKPGRNP